MELARLLLVLRFMYWLTIKQNEALSAAAASRTGYLVDRYTTLAVHACPLSEVLIVTTMEALVAAEG